MATEAPDQPFSVSQTSHGASSEDAESLSPLEQEVLDEYASLLGNLNNVRPLVTPRQFSLLAPPLTPISRPAPEPWPPAAGT